MNVVPTPSIPPKLPVCRLDRGESAVLAVAIEGPDAQVVLDDLAARRCAQALGMQLQGTLGLILVAKSLGRVQEVRPILDSVRKAGLHVSERLVRAVLDQAGE